MEYYQLPFLVFSRANHPHVALLCVSTDSFLIKYLHGSLIAVDHCRIVLHGFQHECHHGLEIVLVNTENPVTHGLPGKRKSQPLPFFFLPVFRDRKLKLVVINLGKNGWTRLAPFNQRIFEFIRQISGNNNRLGLIRAGLAGFHASVFAGFTCASAVFASMAGILVGEMVVTVNVSGNTHVFRVDQFLTNAFQFTISAARTRKIILWNGVLMDNNGKVSNNLFLSALLFPLVTRDFNSLSFNRLRNGSRFFLAKNAQLHCAVCHGGYLLRSDIFYLAYQNLYANNGAATKGVTDDTADGFSEKKCLA